MNDNSYIQEIVAAGRKNASAEESLKKYHAVVGGQKGTETDTDIQHIIEECESVSFNLLEKEESSISRQSNIESMRLAAYIALLDQAKKVLKNKKKPADNESVKADAAYFIALRALAKWLEIMPAKDVPDQITDWLGLKTRNSSTDLFLEE